MSLRFRNNQWTPPSNRAHVGADVQQWVKDNKMIIIIGAIALVGVVVLYMNKKRISDAMGSSAVESDYTRPKRRRGAAVGEVVTTAVPGKIVTTVTTAPTNVAVNQQPTMVPVTQPACGVSQGPVPFDVFQDNLSSGGDGVQPAVAFGGIAGLPVDYTSNSSGVNPSAVWQSSQLLPGANCGQSLEGTDDWSLYAPSNAQVVNFLSAGFNSGQDTISSTLKNASLDLRPSPSVNNCFTSPFNQSSWVEPSLVQTDWSHSLVA